MAAESQKENRKIITSFMLRFVRDAEAGEGEPGVTELSEEEYSDPLEGNQRPSWRGVVKHIQSGAEHHFTTLEEAELFIKKYIED